MNRLRWHMRQLVDLILEQPCSLCQRSAANALCLDCQRQIQRCQLPAPSQFQPGSPSIFAWGTYGGSLKRAIAALKFDGHPHLARPLAHWLAQTWLASDRTAPPLTVVPIPIHPSKRQQRGFNQAELLAEGFCERTRLPLAPHGLERLRATDAQFGLSATQRSHNLAGAFGLGPSFLKRRPAGPVLLLDDIYTTGATVNTAAQTLRRHGISVYGVVVVARAMKEVPTAPEVN